MRKNILAILLVAILVPCLRAVTISVVPSATSARIGDAFAVDITVSEIIDLYAFQFDVSFTPGVVIVTGVRDGLFLNSGGFLTGFMDNELGIITFIADSLSGPVPGITGVGPLTHIDFYATSVGTSVLTVVNPFLLDSNLSEIPVQLVGSQVNISETSSAVPEPGTWLMAAVALCATASARVRLLKQLLLS